LAKLNYYFRDSRVFNVVANGISDLSLRRAEYGSIIKEEGYDVLLEQIQNKILKTRASY
jgi:ABC-type transporter MlaC component